MTRINTVVIGAGQAGLALSRCLVGHGIEHVIVEQGRIAARWAQRRDSLRLLTPNWMTRLPFWSYRGAHPDGFMGRDEVCTFLEAYAHSFDAPVLEQTTVVAVGPTAFGWQVTTDRGTWLAEHVVIATGNCQSTRVPAAGRQLTADVLQVTSSQYRSPAQLADGGVLIVGASASGLQLADELVRRGREVVLAVGRHTRLPRRYRGRDILYWLDRMGALARPLSDLTHPEEGRREPSMQLVGGDPPTTLDLAVLQSKGVRLAGRLTELDGGRARFADDLTSTLTEADARCRRLLGRIDRHIASHGHANTIPGPPALTVADGSRAPRRIDLREAGIRTMLWATGCARAYPWLHAPVLDGAGEIRQVRGRTPAEGLYALGLQFMIRRNSSFIDGVGRDAAEIANEIAWRSGQRHKEAA